MKEVLLAGAVALFPVLAAAQGIEKCATQSEMQSTLSDKYGEQIMARGVDQAQRLIEFYANDETGTWTVVMTPMGQPSCIVADGQHLRLYPMGEAL